MDIREKIKLKQKNKSDDEHSSKKNDDYRIKKSKSLAISKGGECLSDSCPDAYSRLEWQCEQGHNWPAAFHNVVNRGQWCPRCSAKKANSNRHPEWSSIKKLAKDNGGRLLSNPDEYENCKSKLKWECKEGHVWKASLDGIKYQKTWCPYCKSGYRENLVRFLFEETTGLKFPKSRPKWLVNPVTERLLELDGFNEKHSVAFEYNGRQHNTHNDHFHQKTTLEAQKFRDILKANLCDHEGVSLCVIESDFTDEQLRDYIIVWCESQGLPFVKTPNLDDFKNYKFSRHENFKRFVESLGYELLSSFKTVNHKVDIKCDNGHLWTVQPRAVNNGNRCPFCSNKVKYTLEGISQRAKKLGLRCLESVYVNNTVFMFFQCDRCGRKIKRTATSIMNGKGCKCGQ